MDDYQVPVVSTDYYNIESVTDPTSLPPSYESTSQSESRRGTQNSIPSRYQRTTEVDGRNSSLADDLRRTAEGRGRRTRRTGRTAAQQPRRIDADTVDAGSDDSSVDEDYEVASILSSIEERLTWRGRMQSVLHSNWVHLIIVLLVCLDAFIVLFELLLEVGALNNIRCYGETPIEQNEFCHYDTDGDCGPLAIQILEHRNITPSHGTGDTDLCVCTHRQGILTCDRADEPDGIDPANVLHIASLVILSVFMVEIILKIVAFRLKYFTHKFELFDGGVVIISWILDLASIILLEVFESVAQFIILLRLWRVVRIVNGAIHSSKTQSDKKLEDARTEARKIIHAFHKCQDKLEIVEEEKAKLIKQVEVYKAALNTKSSNAGNLNTDH